MAKCVQWVARAALVVGAVVVARPDLQAAPILDPAGDLRTFDPANPNSYAGPATPSLDGAADRVVGLQSLAAIERQA